MNSHGDYSVQQLIYNDNSKTTVIDFETAKKLPIIWEVLRSYSYIDEEAKIYTYYNVSQDNISLFGFKNLEEKES